MNKLDNALRIAWTKKIEDYFKSIGEEVLHEKDNILWIPTLDSEDNAKWIKVNVQVPTKASDDEGYENERAYQDKKVADELKAKEKAEAKAKKIAADKAKREAKAKGE